MEKIDLVVPYVDSLDPTWQKLFNKYNPLKDEEIEGINARNRFRGQGNFFKFFFRCIERNLPWINNIFLLVQSDSQVPSWINRNTVTIILHDQFIPKEYLPTFNSTTIEMFLWNIPGLSEKFIYTNDDFFAVNRLNPTDYFNGDRVRQMSSLKFSLHSIYGHHLFNNYCLAYRKTPEEREQILKNGKVPGFGHTFFPYLKSLLKKAYDEYYPEISASISMFRTENNINHMFFSHYLIKNHYQDPLDRIILNGCINSKTRGEMIELILNRYMIVAIQDTDAEPDVYQGFTLNSWFNRKFPSKSKYEK